MKAIKNGQTSVVLRLKLVSSATSQGLTGLTSASSGLKIGTIADNEATTTVYTVAASNVETITTLGTFAAPTSGKCRFKEVDATNHPGVYEFQFDDARFAVSNAKELTVSVSGATNLLEMDYSIPLVADDPFVAKPANFATLSIDGSGRVDVGKWIGTAVTLSSGVPDTNVKTITTGIIAAASFAANALDAVWATSSRGLTDKANFTLSTAGIQAIWDAATSALTTAGSVGRRIADFLTGDAFVRLGAPAGASHAADIASVKNDTGTVIPSRLPAALTVAGNMKSDVEEWLAATAPAMTGDAYARIGANGAGLTAIPFGAVWDVVLASHLTAGSVGAALNAAGSAGDPWNTALPGAYAVGSAGYIIGTNIDALISSRMGTFSYTVPLDAAGTRTAIGLGSANLDTQLGALATAILTRLAASSYAAPLDAAGTRTAVGLAAANLDTQFTALAAIATLIKASTDNLPSDPADASTIAGLINALNDITVADIIAGISEGSLDFQEMMRIILAACVGKSSGHENGLPRYRDQADTKDRIAATTDADGNRTAMVVDGS